MGRKAAYLGLSQAQFEERVERALAMLKDCRVCPRECRVDRSAGEVGDCRVGEKAVVASHGPHHGEEDPLRGWKGSGTIFFSGCNLHCEYCQNAAISQQVVGAELGAGELAEVMIGLQKRGCHNINLVSPTHVVPQILEAVYRASGEGLTLPLVYNTGGYDRVSTLKLLAGIVDIYMPDMKYADPALGEKYSDAEDYPLINQRAVKEMHRQVGDLSLDERGIAERGLLIRHLVLPDGMAGTREVLIFLAEEISRDTYLNLMDQYRPAYRAGRYPGLQCRVSRGEFQALVNIAQGLGLRRLDGIQSP